MTATGDQMRSLVTLADDLSLKTATARVAKLLAERGRAVGGGTPVRLRRADLREEQIAALVGTVRVHVSRSLKALATMGAITLERDTIRINDLNAPEAFLHAADNVLRLTPPELTWTAGPQMLPPGASMALIEGSPSKPGSFTFRLRFPANYRIPAHWHPVKVTVTVISGTFHMGLGDELDTANGKTLPAGSIFEMPAKIHHFGWTSEETVIQEHGVGPLTVNYLGAAHEERRP